MSTTLPPTRVLAPQHRGDPLIVGSPDGEGELTVNIADDGTLRVTVSRRDHGTGGVDGTIILTCPADAVAALREFVLPVGCPHPAHDQGFCVVCGYAITPATPDVAPTLSGRRAPSPVASTSTAPPTRVVAPQHRGEPLIVGSPDGEGELTVNIADDGTLTVSRRDHGTGGVDGTTILTCAADAVAALREFVLPVGCPHPAHDEGFCVVCGYAITPATPDVAPTSTAPPTRGPAPQRREESLTVGSRDGDGELTVKINANGTLEAMTARHRPGGVACTVVIVTADSAVAALREYLLPVGCAHPAHDEGFCVVCGRDVRWDFPPRQGTSVIVGSRDTGGEVKVNSSGDGGTFTVTVSRRDEGVRVVNGTITMSDADVAELREFLLPVGCLHPAHDEGFCVACGYAITPVTPDVAPILGGF